MITRTINIVLRGIDESDLEDGFNEAVGRLRDGNTCGHDYSERGSIRFDCTDADVGSTLKELEAEALSLG